MASRYHSRFAWERPWFHIPVESVFVVAPSADMCFPPVPHAQSFLLPSCCEHAFSFRVIRAVTPPCIHFAFNRFENVRCQVDCEWVPLFRP